MQILMVIVMFVFRVGTERTNNRNTEHGKYQGLNDAYDQLEKIKRNGTQAVSFGEHDGDDILTTINIPIQSHGERHWANTYGNELEQPYEYKTAVRGMRIR